MKNEIAQLAAGKAAFAARRVGEEMVLVPMKESVADMNEMFTLNEVGCLIYEHLKVDSTEETLTDVIVAEFDIDRDTALADLREFLSGLQALMNAQP